MMAKWAWTYHYKFVAGAVLWLMLLTFILFLFMVMQPKPILESQRPYFSKAETTIRSVVITDRERSADTILTVSVQNNDRPASNVVSQLLVFDRRLDPTIEPLKTSRRDSANNIGRSSVFNYYGQINLGANLQNAFVVFEISYTDASTGDAYSQIWFMKFANWSWDSASTPLLFSATTNDQARIEAYIKQRNIPMLGGELDVQG